MERGGGEDGDEDGEGGGGRGVEAAKIVFKGNYETQLEFQGVEVWIFSGTKYFQNNEI